MTNEDVRKEFWDKEYEKEVTGLTETLPARKAADIFLKNYVKKVLDVGCGLGVDTMYFARHGLVAHGMDVSRTAIEKAKKLADRRATFEAVGALEANIPDGSYDGIFCSKVLHQFRNPETEEAAKRLFHWLKNGGVAVITVMSTDDEDFGKGEKVEEGTFLKEPGLTTHYFTEAELKDLLIRHGFHNITMERFEEFGRVANRDRSHRFIFATAKKVVIYDCNEKGIGDARKVQRR